MLLRATVLLLLLAPCLGEANTLQGGWLSKRSRFRQADCDIVTTVPPNAAATPLPVRLRPVLVPALSYGGLAAMGYGAAKFVAHVQGLSAAFGNPMSFTLMAAIAWPAASMFVEYRLFGGGQRVAMLMGGAPADNDLRALATDIAQRAGLKPPAHVFEIPTNELNAFAAGFGSRDATVAVTSGLRSQLTDAELEAIIAHEIGHIRHSDMQANMHMAVAIAGLGGIYEYGRFLVNLEEDYQRGKTDEDEDDRSSLLPMGCGLMIGGATARMAAHLLQLSMSRTAEYDADRVAAELCGSDAMISALKAIQRDADEKHRRRAIALSYRRRGLKCPPSLRSSPRLSGFRRGAFAHSYISNGAATRHRGKKTPWFRLKNALATHPTTDDRIIALATRYVPPPQLSLTTRGATKRNRRRMGRSATSHGWRPTQSLQRGRSTRR